MQRFNIGQRIRPYPLVPTDKDIYITGTVQEYSELHHCYVMVFKLSNGETTPGNTIGDSAYCSASAKYLAL